VDWHQFHLRIRVFPVVYGTLLFAVPETVLTFQGTLLAGLGWLEPVEAGEFEPAVASQIRHACESARKNPDDADAAGKLGMLFQCYGKYELARKSYQRALLLAPGSFRWTY
jgi:Flp pilus assembly protein TadD